MLTWVFLILYSLYSFKTIFLSYYILLILMQCSKCKTEQDAHVNKRSLDKNNPENYKWKLLVKRGDSG